MGSDIGHVSMYYTEEEPPVELIGKKRHHFGKPSLKGLAAGGQGNRSAIDEGNMGTSVDGAVMSQGTMSKDEALFKNSESFGALKKIYSSPKDLRVQLSNQFRSLDYN